MLVTVGALAARILSNPAANMLQKKLSETNSAILINLYSYLFLSLFCIYPALNNNWYYGSDYWCYAALAGILCTLGSVCLIKALQCGEMSLLGPINSYKCIVGLFLGFVILGEVPDLAGIAGVIFIIWGSWYIFDTTKEGFSLALFKRKDIILRFCALFFTGCEAVVLKKIILMSSPEESFILWCFLGFIFTVVLMLIYRVKFKIFTKQNLGGSFLIALFLGVMQLSTNIVFENLNVGLSLALFQLSSIAAVLFGYKVFHERNILKKLLGSLIMIIGSCFILL